LFRLGYGIRIDYEIGLVRKEIGVEGWEELRYRLFARTRQH